MSNCTTIKPYDVRWFRFAYDRRVQRDVADTVQRVDGVVVHTGRAGSNRGLSEHPRFIMLNRRRSRMAAKSARRVVEEYIEAYNERDIDHVESLWAEEIQSVGDPLDREELLAAIEAYWEGFPDCEISEEQYLSTDEFVVVRITFSGTHTNEYHGIEPTGESFAVVEMMMFHVDSEEIDGYWYAWDELGFWEQLGVLEHPLH